MKGGESRHMGVVFSPGQSAATTGSMSVTSPDNPPVHTEFQNPLPLTGIRK